VTRSPVSTQKAIPAQGDPRPAGTSRPDAWNGFKLVDAVGPALFSPSVLALLWAHANQDRLTLVAAIHFLLVAVHVPLLLASVSSPERAQKVQESWAASGALVIGVLPWVIQASPSASFPLAIIILTLIAFDTMYMSLRSSAWWRILLVSETVSYAAWLAFHGEVVLTLGVIAFGLHMLDGQQGIRRVLAALRREQEHSEVLANTDPLTGLLNRRGLAAVLDEHTAGNTGASTHGITHAVIDVDNFKQVNDRFGHEEGDRSLRSIARRIQDILGPTWSVARTGGDEFMAVAANGSIAELQKLKAELAAHTRPVGERAVHLSIGVASGFPSSDLVSDASEAVHQAKLRGKNQIVVVDTELRERIRSDRRLLALLPQALNNGEICMWAQPIVEADSNTIFGFECLARWHQADGTAIEPDTFIPLVSKAGLMGRMGELALREASQFALKMPSGTKVTVNISAGHLLSEGFLNSLRAIMHETGASPSAMIIEITESEGLDNTLQSAAIAREVRRLGFGLAVDDFGSGYSSVERLIKLPLSHLKIDRVLVQTCTNNATRHLLAGVTHFASKAGVLVVAEGVETVAQADALTELGLNLRQGFLYGRPEPMEQVLDGLDATPATAHREAPPRAIVRPLTTEALMATSQIDRIP